MLNEDELRDTSTPDEGLDATLQWIESELLFRGAHVTLCGRSSVHQRSVAILMLLQAWQQPPHIQIAGTLFEAYRATEDDEPLFALSERETVRYMVGEPAERLIFLSSVANPQNAEHVPATSAAAAGECEDLAVIELAAAACSSMSDGAPCEWLGRASAFAESIRTRPLPVFDNCTAVVSRDAEGALLDAYSKALELGLGQPDAIRALSSASESVPWVGEPFVVEGLYRLAAEDRERAAACGDRAIALLQAWNNAWDKRLSAVDWLGIAQMLRHAVALQAPELSYLAGRVSFALQIAKGRPEGLFAQLKSLELIGRATVEPPVISMPTEADTDNEWSAWGDLDVLPPRFAKYIGGLRDNRDSPNMPWYPDIDGRPIWDVLELDIARELQRKSTAIAEECALIEPSRFAPATGVPVFGADWRLCILVQNGTPQPILGALPETRDVISRYTENHSLGEFACIARLAPGSRTGLRRESSNLRVRCMLPLDAPDTGGVVVEHVSERFREGHCIVLSESAVRQEWNDAHRDQLLLIVQLWHPDLSADEIELLEGLSRLRAAAIAEARHWRASGRDAP